MNATKWGSLTSFVKHVGRLGRLRVEVDDNDEFNLTIRLVDNTVVDTSREKNLQTDEERQMKFLQAQVEKGQELEQQTEKTEHKSESKPILLKTPVRLTLKGLSSKKTVAPAVFGSDSDDD